MNIPNDEDFGTARKAISADCAEAKMHNPKAGPYLMRDERGKPVYATTDGSLMLQGGAGSSKTAAYLVPAIAHSMQYLGMNGIASDPRGELGAMLPLIATINSFECVPINFGRFSWMPHFCTNVWDYLARASDSLNADCMEAFEDVIPVTKNTQGKSCWFEDDARLWGAAMMTWLVLRDGRVSPKSFYNLLGMIQGNIDLWANELEAMIGSRNAIVADFAYTIMQEQKLGKEGFTAPLGTLKAAFAFCKEEHYANAVSGDDISLDTLADPDRNIFFVLAPPFEHLELLAPAMRMLFSRAIRAKLKRPGGRRLGFWIDEAGQLGAFRRIPHLFTFARGAGCFTVTVYQEGEQVFRCFGRHMGAEIIGTAQYSTYRSVGIETSRAVSEKTGEQTYHFNDPIKQSHAKAERDRAAQKILMGYSLSEIATDLNHIEIGLTHQSSMRRRVLTTDEVYNSKNVIGFALRILCGPLIGSWLAYYEDNNFNGLILNNPWHDKPELGPCVRMPGRLWGSRLVPIVEETVPDAWSHYPQYQQGFKLRYPRGFRPCIPRMHKQRPRNIIRPPVTTEHEVKVEIERTNDLALEGSNHILPFRRKAKTGSSKNETVEN